MAANFNINVLLLMITIYDMQMQNPHCIGEHRFKIYNISFSHHSGRLLHAFMSAVMSG